MISSVICLYYTVVPYYKTARGKTGKYTEPGGRMVRSGRGYFPESPTYNSHKIFTKIENQCILKNSKNSFSTLNKSNITSF